MLLPLQQSLLKVLYLRLPWQRATDAGSNFKVEYADASGKVTLG